MGSLAVAQTQSLTLASGSAVAGSSTTLALTLGSPVANPPAALQWTLSYAPGSLGSISVSGAAGLAAAGKNVTCQSGAGSVTCLAVGMNANPIGSGVVATVTVSLPPSASASSVPVAVTQPFAANAAGNALMITGNGGVISVSSSIPILSGLQCSPQSLAAGASATCTATLSLASPTGGTAVILSDNSTFLTTPVSLTIPAGSTSGTFSVAAGSIPSDQSATVTATLGGVSQTATISLVAPVTITSLACAPTSLNSGASSTCTVTLSKAVATSGTAVAVSDNSALLTVPSSVTVAAGATTVTFAATAGTIPSDQSATVTATLGGVSQTATINLAAQVTLTSLSCNPTSLNSSASSTCTVTLSKAAPTSGTVVALSNNNPLLSTPAALTVTPSATTATFTATAGTVPSSQTATVTGSLNSASVTTTLSLQPSTNPSGLISAYGFDEGSGSTVTDASGNGLTGRILNATWTTGKYGSALSFNGSNAYVSLSTTAALRTTGSLSWSAWVYATGSTSADGQIAALSNNTLGWQLKTTGDTGSRTFGVAVSDGSGLTQRYSRTVVAANKWYHVAGVYNAATQTLDIYVNGILDNGGLRGTVPSAQVVPNLTASVGKRSGGDNFRGTIDNLRIYNRALSAAEIPTDMNAAVRINSQAAAAVQVTSLMRQPGADSREAVQPVATLAAPRSLSCSSHVVAAGTWSRCELHVEPSSVSQLIQLTTSSDQLKVPAALTTRPNQSKLTFRIYAEPAANQQSVIIAATSGDRRIEESVLVEAAAGPVLTAPARQFARVGGRTAFAVGVADPAGLPVRLAATSVPSGATFDVESGRFEWIPLASQLGTYSVTISAANTASQSSAVHVAVEVDSGRPVLDASQPLVCSPGAVARLTGRWLANPALGATRVSVNGQLVPVLRASTTAVEFLCPALEPGTAITATVEAGPEKTEPVNAFMRGFAPRILTVNSPAEGQGYVSFPGTNELVVDRNYRVPAHPAQPEDAVWIWVTGLGALPESPFAGLSVTIGDIPTKIDSLEAVADRPGVYAVQVRVPKGAQSGDAVPLDLLVDRDGEMLRSNRVTVAVEDAQ